MSHHTSACFEPSVVTRALSRPPFDSLRACSYVHTNCLAALANIAPHLRKLHPHAARCLLSLCDLFTRKLLKHLKRARAASATSGDDAADGSGGGGDAGGAGALALPTESDSYRSDGVESEGGGGDTEAAAQAAELLRIALEVSHGHRMPLGRMYHARAYAATANIYAVATQHANSCRCSWCTGAQPLPDGGPRPQ